MTREEEEQMLARCVDTARGSVRIARNQQEANVFRLAAMVSQTHFPSAHMALMAASNRYFEQFPDALLDPSDVINKGWIIDLPRLRDRLARRLAGGAAG